MGCSSTERSLASTSMVLVGVVVLVIQYVEGDDPFATARAGLTTLANRPATDDEVESFGRQLLVVGGP